VIRTVLIFVYITLVLLISGLARAADFAQVDKVEFDAQSSMLHVSGQFMNSCQHDPEAVVIATADAGDLKNVLLGVQVKSAFDQMCAQVIDHRYDLVLDVRSLELPAQQNLVLKFANVAEGHSLDTITTRIDRPANGLQGTVKSVSGQLVEVPSIGFNNEPMYVVIGSNSTATEVQSPIDLSAYLNRTVHISGIALSQTVAPAIDNNDLDYRNSTSQKLEKVFATEISLTPSIK
jgi:hypothetical protein